MSMQLTPGKIFLADDRGLLENKVHRRYSTFNFAGYQNEHKQPFGRLHTFNEEILSAGGQLSHRAGISGYVLLVPVTGALAYGQHGLEAEAGTVLLVPVFKDSIVDIRNPYSSDWINFLCIEIEGNCPAGTVAQTFDFDMEQFSDQLIPIISRAAGLPFALHIGRFRGRQETALRVDAHHTAFAFVIGGAFEFQNRLLHERDGLALWDVQQVEAEALSNGTVLLLLELAG